MMDLFLFYCCIGVLGLLINISGKLGDIHDYLTLNKESEEKKVDTLELIWENKLFRAHTLETEAKYLDILNWYKVDWEQLVVSEKDREYFCLNFLGTLAKEFGDESESYLFIHKVDENLPADINNLCSCIMIADPNNPDKFIAEPELANSNVNIVWNGQEGFITVITPQLQAAKSA